jgi:hypothetical protein
MKRLLLLACLGILATIPAWSQLSTVEKAESTTCFSSSELAAFEAAIQGEMAQTVKKAVDAAVVPHIEYEKRLQADLKAMTFQRNMWCIGALAVEGVFAITVVLLILKTTGVF